MKIIDDNIDVVNSEAFTTKELDEFLTQEDAPQVVGVIDDRPLALRLDDYRKNSKWKLIGSDDEESQNNQLISKTKTNIKIVDRSKNNKDHQMLHKTDNDSDTSPPRRSYFNENYESSIKVELKHRHLDSSPSYKNLEYASRSPPRTKNHIESDISPPRRIKTTGSKLEKSGGSFSKREDNEKSDSDASTSHRNRHDLSPRGKLKYELESYPSSPYKNRKKHLSSKSRFENKSDSDTSPPRKRSEKDLSPRRKQIQKLYTDTSPLKKYKQSSNSKRKYDQNSDSNPNSLRKNDTNHLKINICTSYRDKDFSPPRKQNRTKSDSDERPPHIGTEHKHYKKFDVDRSLLQKTEYSNRIDQKKYKDLDSSSIRTSNKKSRWADASPPRHHTSETDKREQKESVQEIQSIPSSSKKMEKTLDGKKAGLQNTNDLKHETAAFKKREDELFKKMSGESCGQNAAPIIRDRRTGMKRDFVKEAMEEFEKLKQENEQKEKYDRWGKGLKQVDDLKQKIESDLHEMNKPLARYADDEDLEAYLREQEREGDPMLQYIRKKKKKEAVASGKPGNIFLTHFLLLKILKTWINIVFK